MSYKLYTDRNENFECEVSVKNASLKGSIARLVVESEDGINFIFKGNIEDGKCVVPVRRLKGLLDENAHGNIFLEMIVEDTYFKPWSDSFVVEEHTSVKVKMNEQKQSNKPIVEVKNAPVIKRDKKVMTEKKDREVIIPVYELVKLCEKFDITRKNISTKKQDLKTLIKEYFNFNPEFKHKKTLILQRLKYLI